MLHCNYNYFIFNNEVKKSGDFHFSCFEKGSSVYEVFRVIKGIPLFYHEHIERLFQSAEMTNFSIWLSRKEILLSVKKLIEINKVTTGNVEIIFNSNNTSNTFLALFIENRYPTTEEYKNGIPSVLYYAEREMPNAKRIVLNLRQNTVEEIKKQNIYDVILVDRNGYITEGSRSNIFFIKDKDIYTTPVHQVLPGITRQKIFDICQSSGIKLIEQKISANEINQFDSAFFTGTSPKVLPISRIQEINFDTRNTILEKIMFAYNNLISENIAQQKNIFNNKPD